ncbi:glycosyltransferase family 2 protein [Jiella sonneratiae]|uniref:Glycosyltransferase n=1 Tax=Jiella sonneratiae TaxID=2816856 RepID=A0ABS3J3E4_9HYPH|nr:glycosyltransferase family 2 protein [Jiella sonneratiae]MBO0904191.1 glycosyltransferase [Jiella sonneratiae]
MRTHRDSAAPPGAQIYPRRDDAGKPVTARAGSGRSSSRPTTGQPAAAGPEDELLVAFGGRTELWPAPDGPFSARQLRVLDILGIAYGDALEAVRAAQRHGSDVVAELVAAGRTDERRFAEIAAIELDLRLDAIAAEDRILNASTLLALPPPRLVRVCNDRLDARLFVCPTLEGLDGLAAYLERLPSMRAMLRIATPSCLAEALDRQTMAERLRDARLSLSAETPGRSARTTLAAGQAALGVAAAALASLGLAAMPHASLELLHAAASTFFGTCLAFRLPAAFTQKYGPAALADLPAPGVLEKGWQGVPVYSVLVALHDEAEMMPQLVAALERLDWPKTRLDIKLVCEADDAATITAAALATRGKPHFSIVRVPPSAPRTKPKALNHALPLAHGEFLVLYDAEDEPDPGQLREAYLRFRTGPHDLACLQAPLVVTNGAAHWLAALFALEYAALFGRLLPWLAGRGLPMPLGGTSNHFVRSRLVAAGGWDSHNVTEDADLGIRLHRAGYRVATITRPTFEHAPERWTVWHRQRTRWMKGWFVTYLLHMRRPLALRRDLGGWTMAAFQLLFLGMLLSSIAHPLLLGCIGLEAAALATGALSLADIGPIEILDMINVVLAYGLFAALSARGWHSAAQRPKRRIYLLLPAYWVLLALASARALLQLLVDPHKWEKTPHGRAAARAAPGDAGHPPGPAALRPPAGPAPLPDAVAERLTARLEGAFAAGPWPVSEPRRSARARVR